MHKIPQNVTNYESKIIGNFTPRQFIYLAIGGAFIMLMFMLPFPIIIRIASAAFIAPVSIAMSLGSYDGRRSDTWVLNMGKSIFSPTQRIWIKEEIPPDFLLPSYRVPHTEMKNAPKTASELDTFLDYWRTNAIDQDYTDEEKEFLRKVSTMNRYYGNMPATKLNTSEAPSPVKIVQPTSQANSDNQQPQSSTPPPSAE